MIDEKLKKEWAESLVTKKLLEAIDKYIDVLQPKIDIYHPFEPQRTQEILAGLNGSIDAWEDIKEVLEGNWELIDVEEQDGDLPGRE